MAFLSIQSVDNGGLIANYRSPAQLASYVSITLSLGSVIVSLLLVRKHRSQSRQPVDEAVSITFVPSLLKSNNLHMQNY